MWRNKILIIGSVVMLLFMFSCSNQKNTKQSRIYHEINTRYNIYYNAEIAYEEALKGKEESYQDNLSEMIYMYPTYPADQGKLGGFDITIDKCVKAIKLHSIQAKPERNPNKRGDESYQEWLKQKEFNPFLKSVWLLMAKAEYQSLDYVKSISTFSYITRLFKNDPDVVAEAKLWMAKAYTQMGWDYEADNIFHQLELTGGVPDNQKDLFSEIYANYLVRNKQYEKSVPYLEHAIKEAGGLQKTRLRYLLGQVYGIIGNNSAAYKAFDDAQGLTTPYLYTLNARLQQVKYINPENTEEKKNTLSVLKGMAGKKKNEEYLDQIYYAIGNIYMIDKDTLNTIANYKLAIEKSTRSGYDKAITQIALGDIYFKRRDYVKAQPLYPDALGVLGKTYARYNELSLRSEVLDELVVYAEALHLQDSLQVLANMTENQRLLVINKIIEDQKEKDKQEERERAQEEWRAENPDDVPDMTAGMPTRPGVGGSSFYFYNRQTVAQGKTSFKRTWGTRKLEDNWRRKDKSSTAFDDFDTNMAFEDGQTNIGDSTLIAPDGTPIAERAGSDDKYTPEYYLKQIPLTPEALAESNAIIEDAYFQMGLIYKNKLEDLLLAIDAFDTDVRRFPQTQNLEEIYYQLFLIYSQMGNKSMADLYRNKLISEFPTGDYAITLSDPNYEWNMRNIKRLENELYESTYQAYLAGNTRMVQNNYSTVREKYPLSELMPKFVFLNALTYAQVADTENFKTNLKDLIDKYPKSEVAPLASDMLKELLSGKILVGGGPMRGMIWDIPFTGEDFGPIDSTLTFVDNRDIPYRILLIYDPDKIDKNELLYNVADYNFSNFILQTFDLSFTEIKPFEILQIQGLNSFKNTVEYVNKAFADSALIDVLDPSIIMLPISDENYSTLTRGRSLNDYFKFFAENYGSTMPQLVKYWNSQMKSVKEELEAIQPEEHPEQPSDTTLTPTTPVETTTPKDGAGSTAVTQEEPKQITPPKKEDGVIESQPEKEDGIETIITDDTIQKIGGGIQDTQDAINEVLSNPVDGIKNIISKVKNKEKLTKEEKEQIKEEKRLQKELQKQQREREKAVTDSIQAEEKAKQNVIKQAEKEKEEMEKAAERAKEDARKAAIKEKEDTRKARQQELKEKERLQQEKLKERERERKNRQKQREQERKERLKQVEQERETKRKQREQELKQKEKEREQRLKERERERKSR